MTDFSQYSGRRNAGRAWLEAVLSPALALQAKAQGFLADEENRAELRRLLLVFSIRYALVALFAIVVVAFFTAEINLR